MCIILKIFFKKRCQTEGGGGGGGRGREERKGKKIMIESVRDKLNMTLRTRNFPDTISILYLRLLV